MDTGEACVSCQVLVEDRRVLRRTVAKEVHDERVSGRLVIAESRVRREIEHRLQQVVREEMDRREAARKLAAAQQPMRQASYKLRRQVLAETERARAAAPCADCGLPEAGGLCLVCTERRGTQAAMEEAIDMAIVLQFDANDASATRSLRDECARATRAALEERLEHLRDQGLDETALAFNGRRLMEGLRDRRRRAAIATLSQHGEGEGDQAVRTAATAKSRTRQQPGSARAHNAVSEVGEGAIRRTAERWLGVLLAQLRVVCSLGPAPVDDE
ncbi:hypothetical protein [Streptomyces broussonetiae]|uniref:hypothetical protein n=1 Tax=Streptomyces broussonetiae TaxID=2686304 RepID=UPI0035E38FE0